MSVHSRALGLEDETFLAFCSKKSTAQRRPQLGATAEDTVEERSLVAAAQGAVPTEGDRQGPPEFSGLECSERQTWKTPDTKPPTALRPPRRPAHLIPTAWTSHYALLAWEAKWDPGPCLHEARTSEGFRSRESRLLRCSSLWLLVIDAPSLSGVDYFIKPSPRWLYIYKC